MGVVDTKPSTHTTQATILAVENWLISITEQSARFTVILCQLPSVADLALAELPHLLDCGAVHACHLQCCISIYLVVALFIMAKPTGEEFPTALSANLGLPSVMFATEDVFCFVLCITAISGLSEWDAFSYVVSWSKLVKRMIILRILTDSYVYTHL